MNFPHPDVDYSSDSDSDELTYADEWLKNVCAVKHIVSIIQPMPGRLATFNVKSFSTEPVASLFNTGATCSCISFSLYSQISDKAQMLEMQLWVGQTDGMSLCPKVIVKVILESNDKQFEHTFILCQNPKQPLLFGMDFTQNYRIGID